MIEQPGFAGLVPGFDFLQGLMRNAGQALPGVGQWVAPTLDPAELDKRISELRTVQFWLEQNAQMLNATIQALEVQRMTLNTLRTMNVSLGDLRDAMTLKMPTPSAAPSATRPAPAPSPTSASWTSPAAPASGGAGPEAASSVLSGVVDPMLWWGALTRQFGELAAHALKESTQAGATAATVAPKAAPTGAVTPPAGGVAAASKGSGAVSPPQPISPTGAGKPAAKAASKAAPPRTTAPGSRKKSSRAA